MRWLTKPAAFPKHCDLRIATDHGSAAGPIRGGLVGQFPLKLVAGQARDARRKSFSHVVQQGDGVSKSRFDLETVVCAADGCSEAASIIHSGAPYCGKHALEAWQREEDDFDANKRSRKRLSIRA